MELTVEKVIKYIEEDFNNIYSIVNYGNESDKDDLLVAVAELDLKLSYIKELIS